MPPGQRMVEFACRAAMLDNAEGIAQSTARLDPSRPLQAARLHTLQDLHRQVLDKAAVLKTHMRRRSDSRGEEPRPVGSNRLQADIRNRICIWVVRRRDRERFKARGDTHPELPKPHLAPPGGSEYPVKVFTIVVDCSDDDCFRVTCANPLEVSSFVIDVDGVDRYGALKIFISRRLGTDKFMMVNENKLPLQHLQDDFQVQSISELTAKLLGQAAAEPADQLRLCPPRVLVRKPPNSNQRSKKNDKRMLNEKAKKASTGTCPLLCLGPLPRGAALQLRPKLRAPLSRHRQLASDNAMDAKFITKEYERDQNRE